MAVITITAKKREQNALRNSRHSTNRLPRQGLSFIGLAADTLVYITSWTNPITLTLSTPSMVPHDFWGVFIPGWMGLNALLFLQLRFSFLLAELQLATSCQGQWCIARNQFWTTMGRCRSSSSSSSKSQSKNARETRLTRSRNSMKQ